MASIGLTVPPAATFSMGVDHGAGHIAVAQQFLYRAKQPPRPQSKQMECALAGLGAVHRQATATSPLYLAVQKKQGTERLVVGGHRHIALRGEHGQKLLNLSGSHLLPYGKHFVKEKSANKSCSLPQ